MFIISMYSVGMAQPRVPSVGYLVWHLSLKWGVAVDRALSPLGLTHAPYALLASLYALSQGGARPSQRELADFSGLEVMYVSKLVRSLERAGLLRRSDHPGDPRAFQLELTAAGASLVTKAALVVRELYDELLAPIGGRTSKRAEALMRQLQGLLEHAQLVNRTRRIG
jgi:MarR family transcriptional regulator, organic hydroperoxide resistance regulator